MELELAKITVSSNETACHFLFNSVYCNFISSFLFLSIPGIIPLLSVLHRRRHFFIFFIIWFASTCAISNSSSSPFFHLFSLSLTLSDILFFLSCFHFSNMFVTSLQRYFSELLVYQFFCHRTKNLTASKIKCFFFLLIIFITRRQTN